jgi:hypothetical protein
MEQYNRGLHVLFESTRAMEPFLSLPPPGSEEELGRRLDDIYSAAWPEYQAAVQDADLYRSQQEFLERKNPGLRASIEGMKASIETLRVANPELAAEVAMTEAALAKSVEMKTALTNVALRLLNDQKTAHEIMAYLLVFAPEPRVTREQFDRGVWYEGGLPDEQPRPSRWLSPLLEPLPAEDTMPTQAPERSPVSLAGEPIESKFATLSAMGAAFQQARNDNRYLKEMVPALAQENQALKSEHNSLFATVRPLVEENRQLNERLRNASADEAIEKQNAENAARTAVREAVVSHALDIAKGRMQHAIEELVAVSGLSDKLPTGGVDAVVKMAQEGGRFLIPVEGFKEQWDTFVNVQAQTVPILTRAEGFMMEAARLGALGSPAEMQAYLEIVFASVKWQAVEYAKTIGLPEVPEEERGHVQSVWENFLDARKAKETGE